MVRVWSVFRAPNTAYFPNVMQWFTSIGPMLVATIVSTPYTVEMVMSIMPLVVNGARKCSIPFSSTMTVDVP